MELILRYFINLSLLGLSFVIGYLSASDGSQKVSSLQNISRNMASEEEAHISYEGLDCPSWREYSALMDKIKFSGRLRGHRCNSDSDKGKFGKLIKYMSSIKINLPEDWKGGAHEALRDPLQYFVQMNSGVGLDFSERPEIDGVIAYREANGQVFLRPYFFSLSPLASLLTLIHESRHGSNQAENHVTCQRGFRAQQHKACDSQFTVDEGAGPYAYEVSFVFGLAKYGEGLSLADREYLRSKGLSRISHHFVNIPPLLGLPFETIIVLGDDNNLYYIHPFVRKTILYDYGDKLDILKIKFNRKNNGLYLINQRGEVYVASPFSKAKRYDTSLIAEDVFVKDIEVLTGGSEWHSITITYFLDANNRIWNINFNNDKRKWSSYESSFQADGVEFSQLIHANKRSRYILTEQGRLRSFNQSPSGPYIGESMFQDPREKGWVHVDGGVTYVDTFGVNRDGELFFRGNDIISHLFSS